MLAKWMEFWAQIPVPPFRTFSKNWDYPQTHGQRTTYLTVSNLRDGGWGDVRQHERRTKSRLGDQLFRLFQVDRHQLADTLFLHCHTKQTVHPRHRHRVVRDN